MPMATGQLSRRLSAIVHADVAGFSRMMEGAETRTFRHLKSAQIEVWRPGIERACGRLVGTAGDAMLAEFSSPMAALAAAIDIQERMAAFNQPLGGDQRLLFRIGVHLGEVIVDDEDQNIYGDGVNLAARIQALAEPGGIAVSSAIHDLTELNPDYKFTDGGEHMLKNVSRPVHVYHLGLADAAELRTTIELVPEITLLFDGTDSAGRKFSLSLPMTRLREAAAGLVIGRERSQCDLIVAHGAVSRRHARLSTVGGALEIEDLGSTNRTIVDGTVLTPGAPVVLQSGATVKIGDVTLTMRYG
jgi:class 3 adenylate cyclase